MKKAIYTVNLCNYDHDPIPPKAIGWDRILITDDVVRNPYKWDKVIYIDRPDNPAIEARRYKWLSHIHLSEYELVCYFDANMHIYRTPPEYPFRIIHHKRDNVRQECDALNRQLHRCSIDSVEDQWNAYIAAGFDDSKELWLNGFFVRDHSETENKLCEIVWEIINTFTPRDQLALPYAMWELDYEPKNRGDFNLFRKHVRMRMHRILNPVLHK